MRSRGRRVSAAKRETIWTGIQLQLDTVDSGAVSSLNIVDATDWANDGGFSRGGTLERIRGNISGVFAPVTTASGVLYLGISLCNDTEQTPDPSLVADYVEEDWLWLHAVTLGTISLTSVGIESLCPFNIDVDVKAKRKLTKNSIVLFSYRSAGAGADENFIISAVLRGLVKKV